MPKLWRMTTARNPSSGRKRPVFTVIDRMKKAREEAGLDQQQLADLLAISRQTVGNYETGVTPPRIIVLRAWASACNVDEDWLIDDYQPPARKARQVRTDWYNRRRRYLDIVPGWAPSRRQADRDTRRSA